MGFWAKQHQTRQKTYNAIESARSGPRWVREEKTFAAELKRQVSYISSFKLKGKKTLVGGTVNHRQFQTVCSDYEEEYLEAK